MEIVSIAGNLAWNVKTSPFFRGKIRKNISIFCVLKILPSMLRTEQSSQMNVFLYFNKIMVHLKKSPECISFMRLCGAQVASSNLSQSSVVSLSKTTLHTDKYVVISFSGVTKKLLFTV